MEKPAGHVRDARIHRVNADRIQRHRTLIDEIDRDTEQALRVLDHQQERLLRALTGRGP